MPDTLPSVKGRLRQAALSDEERQAVNQVEYAQLAFGNSSSSKGGPGIILNGSARMKRKMVREAFPVPDNDSAFRAGSQITSEWSGRGLSLRVTMESR